MFRNRIYNMNSTEANRTLQNVFEACNQTPNTTSFDVIRVRNIANTTVVKMGKYIAIVFLMLVLISPLPFVKASENAKTDRKPSRVDVVSHTLKDGEFTLILNGYGIAFDDIYCKKEDGEVIFPDSSDEETGKVVIPFDGKTLNIYIPCTDGKTVQAVLSK